MLPVPWRLWLMLLVASNMVVPLFFINRLEAQVVLGAFAASAIVMTILTGVYGFTRLLGIGHIFWFPLIFFLWSRLSQIPADDFFGIWIRSLMAINAVSLVIDVTDFVRYLRGEREEIVKGL